MWAERGSRPRAVHQTEYQWTYFFGTVCPATGDSNGWIMPRADTEIMNIQLRDFSQQLTPNVHAMLVLDRAGWHKSKTLEVPENITLLLLPPYSPELNPVELIWRYMRQRYLSNRVYLNETMLEEAVGDAWNRLVSNPKQIVSICSFDWIMESTITF